MEQLREFSQWLDGQPIAPEGKWFKRFGTFTICGEGGLVKTVLTADQAPTGIRNEVKIEGRSEEIVTDAEYAC